MRRLFVVSVIFVLATPMGASVSAQTNQRSFAVICSSLKEVDTEDLSKLYDSIEKELTSRLETNKLQPAEKKHEIIKSLGHIRSRKAIPLLLAVLDFKLFENETFPGGFELVNSRMTYENTYPALKALREIGVPFDKCCEELEKSQAGGLTEKLLGQLGWICHKKKFIDYVKSKAESDGSNPRWVNLLQLLPQK
jgi:hypothetical protein